jgi:hypothetical protein
MIQELRVLKNESDAKNFIVEVFNNESCPYYGEQLETELDFSLEYDWDAEENDGWHPWGEGKFTPDYIKRLGDSWEFPCILYIWIEKIEDFRSGGANRFFIIERKSLEELGLQLKETRENKYLKIVKLFRKGLKDG